MSSGADVLLPAIACPVELLRADQRGVLRDEEVELGRVLGPSRRCSAMCKRHGARPSRDALQPFGMAVVGLHHAGVHVSNLARSIAFYEDVFGLRLGERLSLGGEELAFVGLGNARIELIHDGTGYRQTGVVDHIALEVNDLAGLMRRLIERGITLLDQTPVAVPALGARILFCVGPDGERIELFEYAANTAESS